MTNSVTLIAIFAALVLAGCLGGAVILLVRRKPKPFLEPESLKRVSNNWRSQQRDAKGHFIKKESIPQ